MPKYSRFHNRLAEVKNRHYGRVYAFSISIYNGVVEFDRRQEEMLRDTKAVAQAKQGQWLNWEGVEKKKLRWRELWSMRKGILDF